MRIIGHSDIGKVRKENQDAYWFDTPAANTAIAVVCDGMGGTNGGQIASNIAIETVRQKSTDKPIKSNTKSYFNMLISACNQAILDGAKNRPEYVGMGTTMVIAAVRDKLVSFANVGDSRGYHITNGSIQQITKDHSAVQVLVDTGKITERQAKLHPNKNIITRALGLENEVEFDFFEVEALPGDMIVLCTDGLTNFVDENEIQFEASGGDFEHFPQRLIDLANSRGGTDNITVVAIEL